MSHRLLLSGNQNTLVMGKFINPFTDFGFHRIFGQEVHKELLIDFLNQLLEGERHISDITFQNPILQPETLGSRKKLMIVKQILNVGYIY